MELFKFIYAFLRDHCQVTQSTECFQDGNKIKSCMWEIEHFKSALVVEKNPATFICDIKASDRVNYTECQCRPNTGKHLMYCSPNAKEHFIFE